jgi:hypothetical protein
MASEFQLAVQGVFFRQDIAGIFILAKHGLAFGKIGCITHSLDSLKLFFIPPLPEIHRQPDSARRRLNIRHGS